MKRKSRKDHEEMGVEVEESIGNKRCRAESLKEDDEINFTVSYEAATQKLSSPMFNKKSVLSSSSIPSPPRSPSPPHYSPVHTRKQETNSKLAAAQEEGPHLVGVDALMDSIKQAIKLRHDAMELSDDNVSQASSFGSISPPPSPILPAKTTNTPSLPQKPPLSTKPPPNKKPPLPGKPSISKKPSKGSQGQPLPVPKCPPPPPQDKPSSDDVQFRPTANSSRSALLKSIKKGSTLRKTIPNDRSSPRL